MVDFRTFSDCGALHCFRKIYLSQVSDDHKQQWRSWRFMFCTQVKLEGTGCLNAALSLESFQSLMIPSADAAYGRNYVNQ
eukprot:6202899-Pleurochrysis_carterae.AAC.2